MRLHTRPKLWWIFQTESTIFDFCRVWSHARLHCPLYVPAWVRKDHGIFLVATHLDCIDVENYLVIPAVRTLLFFWLTLFLYIGLFVEVLPDYLENSAAPSIHPFVDQAANEIMVRLHRIQPMFVVDGIQ
jgi:hypothetical protein